MLKSPWLALGVTIAAAMLWLAFCGWLAKQALVSSRVSRKLIHIGTGPIFVLCWLLFPPQTLARYLAVLVPLPITLKYLLVGLGVLKDDLDVQAMSRNGDRRELIQGPFYYGVVFILITLFIWKQHPAGIVALMAVCGGDGLADIAGTAIGGKTLPWSKGKTWAGSLAMFGGSLLFSLLILAVFVGAGVFKGPISQYLPGLVVVSLAAALVESLPFSAIDNLTVPATAVILGLLLLP